MQVTHHKCVEKHKKYSSWELMLDSFNSFFYRLPFFSALLFLCMESKVFISGYT